MSDAYVRTRWVYPAFGRPEKLSGNEQHWLGKKMSMGWHRSGEALVLFQALDYDTGLELLDGYDLLGADPFGSSLAVEYNHFCDESGCFENDMPWGLQLKALSQQSYSL